jgi:hypothetical protein
VSLNWPHNSLSHSEKSILLQVNHSKIETKPKITVKFG